MTATSLMPAAAQPQPTGTLLAHGAAQLRRKPSLPFGRPASEIHVSERHLSRGFRGVFGTGFSHQAHVVHDVNAITGAPPEAVFQAPRPSLDR
jgi:AraC-like DNA-binding protein